MLQLQKVILTICTGYACTLLCHHLPIVGDALTLRTMPITQVLTQISADMPTLPEIDDRPAETSCTNAYTESAITPLATPVATVVTTIVTTTADISGNKSSIATTTTVKADPPDSTTETDIPIATSTIIIQSTQEEPADSESDTNVKQQTVSTQIQTEKIPTGAVSLFAEQETWFKAYMDYRTITDTASVQYTLQQNAWTDLQGLRRIGDDYLVAMGTGWLKEGCGDRFLVTLETGEQFTVMVADIKADCHTDASHLYRICGAGANVLEFIVDANLLSDEVRISGSVSAYPALAGNITAITPLS